jgi:hypothetical protein
MTGLWRRGLNPRIENESSTCVNIVRLDRSATTAGTHNIASSFSIINLIFTESDHMAE